MTVYNNLMQRIDDAGLLFNVQKANLFAEINDIGLHGRHGCKQVDNRKALINTKSGKIMSIVSDSYKVVTNEEIFSSFCKNIEDANIDTDGATVNVRQTSTGSRAMVDFTFPAHKISVDGDNSATALQFCALNSFDGSTRYVAKAGGLRMKCMNGQIVGNIIGAYSSLHTKALDVDLGADVISKMLKDFDTSKQYWNRMMQVGVRDNIAYHVIVKFLGIKEYEGAPARPIRKNKRFDELVGLWAQYRRELGDNAYALYNALTHYISHQPKKHKEPANTEIMQRTKLVKMLNNSHSPFAEAA